jgi:tagatose-1,6-bisphosphate aldolase
MTPGKYRHLTRATTPAGHFVILAIDHRANLRSALDKHAPAPLSDWDFVRFKRHLLNFLTDDASAVLTDPAYGIPSIFTRGRLGMLAPIEVTNYDLSPSAREVQYIPNWSVGKIKRMGGDGVKLLLPFHPDEATADARRAVVRKLVDECGRADIPLYLEPITYSLDESRPLTSTELTQITVAMAREFSAMGADILKLQFPVDPAQTTDLDTWRAACVEVTAACGDTPWALLSAGVSFDVFAQQALIACKAGACGVITGRAVWNEAVVMDSEARYHFLQTTGVARMATLARICEVYAARLHKHAVEPDESTDWYERYDDL